MTPLRSCRRSFLPSFLILLVVAGVSPVLADDVDDSGAPPGAQRVWLRAPVPGTVASQVVGRGIAEAPQPAMLSSVGEVVWQVARDSTDELGLRHTFYRQVILPSPAFAEGTGGMEVAAGVPLLGSEVGVHSKDGDTYFVYGYQYPVVELAAQPAIGTARAAYELAQQELERRAGFEVAPWMLWPSERTAQHVAQTRLAARPLDGKTFRLVWQVPTEDAYGRLYVADLDAASGEVTHLEPQWSDAVCTPSTSTQVTAVGKAQNLSIAERSLWATVASDRGTPWTHEGHKNMVSGQMPEITVYMKATVGEAGYYCPGDGFPHGVMPLQTVSGSPRYDDLTTPRGIPGRSAGDALWASYLTLQTLKQKYGRCGPANDCGSPVVVEIDYDSGYDTANGFWEGGFEGVRITPRSARTYTASAALDVVAHEWGHVIVHHEPDWDKTGVRGQLNEGFADVLGYSVEQLNQPSGSGKEKKDWMFFEDAPRAESTCDPGSYNRRVDSDDGEYCYAYHRYDFPISDGAGELGVYAKANMLPVVLRLMSIGGQNPLVANGRCNPSTMPGCDATVNGTTVEKASKTLMRVLTAYAVNSTPWADLADLAMMSAWDLFKRCSPALCPNLVYSAVAEQNSAGLAFTAIGYPPIDSPQQCYCGPNP